MDLSSTEILYREQGDVNLRGLMDKVRILAELNRGAAIEDIIAQSPHGECLLERLESDMSNKVISQ